MAIVVKHSGSPGVTAVAAYGGAQGKRRSQIAESAAGQASAADRVRMGVKASERSAASQRAVEDSRFARNRALALSDEERARSQTLSDRDAARQQALADEERKRKLDFTKSAFDRQQDFTKSEYQRRQELEDQESAAKRRAGESELDFQRRQQLAREEREAENFEYNYTEQQRAEFDKLSQELANAKTSGDYTPDELADLESQVMEKQNAIAPVRTLKKKGRWPEGQDIGDTWTSPEGILLTRNEKGVVSKLDAGTGAAQAKLEAEEAKTLMEAFKKEDEEGNISFDSKGYVKALNELKAARAGQSTDGGEVGADEAEPEDTAVKGPYADGGPGPKKVKSLEEANAQPSGTWIDFNGRIGLVE